MRLMWGRDDNDISSCKSHPSYCINIINIRDTTQLSGDVLQHTHAPSCACRKSRMSAKTLWCDLPLYPLCMIGTRLADASGKPRTTPRGHFGALRVQYEALLFRPVIDAVAVMLQHDEMNSCWMALYQAPWTPKIPKPMFNPLLRSTLRICTHCTSKEGKMVPHSLFQTTARMQMAVIGCTLASLWQFRCTTRSTPQHTHPQTCLVAQY